MTNDKYYEKRRTTHQSVMLRRETCSDLKEMKSIYDNSYDDTIRRLITKCREGLC